MVDCKKDSSGFIVTFTKQDEVDALREILAFVLFTGAPQPSGYAGMLAERILNQIDLQKVEGE